MGIGGIFRFTVDSIAKNISKFLISVSLISISILISIIILFSYLGSSYSYDSLNTVLSSGVKGTGVLLFLRVDAPVGTRDDFLNKVNAIDNIKSIGSTSLGGTQGLEPLAKIQKENSSQYAVQSGGIPEILYLNYNSLKLCELNLEQGVSFEELEATEETRYLYLGNGFKDEIMIGETYEADGLKFIVSGFLKEDSKWVDWGIVNGYTSQKVDYTYPLEYAVVMIEFGSPSMSSVLFSVYDDAKTEETLAQISQLAKDYGLSISVQTLEELYQEESADLIVMRSYIFRLFAIVLFATIVIVSCLQINTIIDNKRTYGIYYSIGITRGDLRKIIIMETFIKTIVSLTFSGSFGALLAKWWFKFSEINLLLNQIYFVRTLPKVSIVALIVVFLSTLIPLLILENYTPRELIGGKDDLFR